MFTATIALLIASYVGPTASPDTGYDAPKTRQKQIRTERGGSRYINPQNQPAEAETMRGEDWTEEERAQEGRMVVPEKFR